MCLVSLAKHRVKHQRGTDMTCLYACLRKDPWINRKFFENCNHHLFPPFSLNSLAAEVCSLLESWDWLKQLGLYLNPYHHRHTCEAPESNSFASHDDKIGPGATGTTDIGKRVIKQRLQFGQLYVFVPFLAVGSFITNEGYLKLFPQVWKKKRVVGTKVNHFCKLHLVCTMALLGLYWKKLRICCNIIVWIVWKKSKRSKYCNWFSCNRLL